MSGVRPSAEVMREARLRHSADGCPICALALTVEEIGQMAAYARELPPEYRLALSTALLRAGLALREDG